MSSFGRRTARVAGLTSLLVVGCFRDDPPELDPSGSGPASTGPASTGGSSTGATTTGIAASTTGAAETTAEPSTSAPSTGQLTTGPKLDMDEPAPATCPSDQALVACYLFEDGWSDGVLVDGGPGGLDGKLTDAAQVAGHRGSAAGTSAATAISVFAPELARTETWTVTAWVKPDAYAEEGRSGVLDRNGDYGLFVLAGGLPHCGGTLGPDGTTHLPLGTWSHVACVWEEPLIQQIYVNGVLEKETAWQPLATSPDEPLVIANDSPPAPAQALIGAVDEVMVWNRLLGAAEICAVAGLDC